MNQIATSFLCNLPTVDINVVVEKETNRLKNLHLWFFTLWINGSSSEMSEQTLWLRRKPKKSRECWANFSHLWPIIIHTGFPRVSRPAPNLPHTEDKGCRESLVGSCPASFLKLHLCTDGLRSHSVMECKIPILCPRLIPPCCPSWDSINHRQWHSASLSAGFPIY